LHALKCADVLQFIALKAY